VELAARVRREVYGERGHGFCVPAPCRTLPFGMAPSRERCSRPLVAHSECVHRPGMLQMALTMFSPPTRSVGVFRSPLMTAAASTTGARTVIILRGEADVSHRPILCDQLCRVIAVQFGDVVIDLSQVRFIDIASVRALATGQMLLESQGRRLTFRSPSRLASQMIHRFGLSDLIEPANRATP